MSSQNIRTNTVPRVMTYAEVPKPRRKHPIFSRIVCRIPGWRIDSSYEEFVELSRTLRGIAFQPNEYDGLIGNKS